MKVSPASPFQLIYSLYEHEYLGVLFESFVIQLDHLGKLTFSHQNISSQNAMEFSEGLDDKDFQLIKIMDSMQQESVVNHFYKKKIKVNEFFLKIYDKEKGNKVLQQEIEQYLERRRSQILTLLPGKELFEMASDGEPAWKKLTMNQEPATVLFHFRKNEDNTHYFPTIKHRGEKLEFQYKGAYIICNEPAWMVLDDKAISFAKNVDGNKLKPFLNKKFIVIPKTLEEQYYEKFVAQVVESYDVYAKGFDIETIHEQPNPVLTIHELAEVQRDLFGANGKGSNSNGQESGKMLLSLGFRYGNYQFPAEKLQPVNVNLENQQGKYTFYRIKRNISREKQLIQLVKDTGLGLSGAKHTMPKSQAIEWIADNMSQLQSAGFEIHQKTDKKRYFLGRSQISIEVRENIDWFDLHAVVKFGDYEIPFKDLRKYILRKQQEIPLPNGEIAVIPESWFAEYSELFAFAIDSDKELRLKKHHLALVNELNTSNLANVNFSKKLEKLHDFEKIDDYEIPPYFKGKLRPYQKAGYNWLRFLQEFRFGGCLADDMGLGKTVQTLALLQSTVDEHKGETSLLVMPTSLIYNWEMEAKKFTPRLKILVYTGTDRNKDIDTFVHYDLVLTSYGITRLDVDSLSQFYFNYIILDESQAIKNPDSNIAKAVKKLSAKNRLILTGTPVENSTMDLWSQMSFINPGLLGSQQFFKNEFQLPIEKKKDDSKTQKLYNMVKPFVMRREKVQVARDLPEKVENVKYCQMTKEQEEAYEQAKSYFRNQLLEKIEENGLGKMQTMLLQGLTKLRQIANHPKLADAEYLDSSGKLEDITHMLLNSLGKGHKILIFSQFVKHLALIEKFVQKEHLKYAYLDGSTRDRKSQVELFQNDDDYNIFLISLKAGGLGLNLTKADYVFILDPWWNPAAENQAVDRAHRIGQTNKVFTYKFITKNTVEEKILRLQQSKLKLAKNLISTEESFMKSLSKEDIAQLLD